MNGAVSCKGYYYRAAGKGSLLYLPVLHLSVRGCWSSRDERSRARSECRFEDVRIQKKGCN